jgi:hypothetical protein
MWENRIMADGNNTAIVAPGVERCECHSGYLLFGRKEDLLASKLVRPEWFPAPGERNSRGQVCRTKNSEYEGRSIRCSQKSARRFCVRVDYSEEDRERHRERVHYEKLLAEEEKELRAMSTSADEYRMGAERWIVDTLESFIGTFAADHQKYDGYCYAPEVLEALDLKVQELRGILEIGRVFFNAAARAARLAEIKAKTAAANPDLRAFLGRVTQQPS